ncbi:hypothetical protein Naga_104238g1 [Nannochloropsis gaditana]|uniref:Uncharacterized protein n=1 Tax=Nannochloropsis gaditana TaxID=72520 RepID=W7TCE8_9STRA|nr:hypothetical protein Naga_104238g1 [Nannochloropsis gaditana]
MTMSRTRSRMMTRRAGMKCTTKRRRLWPPMTMSRTRSRMMTRSLSTHSSETMTRRMARRRRSSGTTICR